MPTDFRTLLSRAGLTHAALARIYGCDERNVRRWVAGDTTPPRLVTTVLRLIAAGKLKADDLA